MFLDVDYCCYSAARLEVALLSEPFRRRLRLKVILAVPHDFSLIYIILLVQDAARERGAGGSVTGNS
jgi:hypothetical protein